MKFLLRRTSGGLSEPDIDVDEKRWGITTIKHKVTPSVEGWRGSYINEQGEYLDDPYDYYDKIIEINTIEELIDFYKQYGDLIITEDSHVKTDKKRYVIEIYDADWWR